MKKTIFVALTTFLFMKQQKVAIIVAGGKGERMKASVPKQFILLGHKPVLMHTLERFYQYSDDIRLILVLPSTQFDVWDELCMTYNFNIPHTVVPGGISRFFSVKLKNPAPLFLLSIWWTAYARWTGAAVKPWTEKITGWCRHRRFSAQTSF
ncbi:MAG: 2-C-methyl-D-erythritol 4-phosphate cytidylyltransferase [Bacteroidetes bacterium]|nr:2-C-methyl-D-erythritol 4-phosphate cytidylyltransferase [Bacteroidota bacterium]